MNAFKKCTAWLMGPKSDMYLLLIILVLANLVSAGAFFRFDLTNEHSYSLSRASKELVSTLDEPLSVKVYFTSNLPAPYNSVERYLRDLMIEYKGAGNKRFSYEFFDTENAENRQQAQAYGLRPVQIQEVKDTEIGLKTAWMGLVLLYGDSIEALDSLGSSDGLEYRLTTSMGRMIAMNDTLSGLTGSINLTLYASSELSQFGISGFKDLEKNIAAACTQVNKKNRNRLSFSSKDPSKEEVDELARRYGIQKINWSVGKNGEEGGSGALGLVLSFGERFRMIPLELSRGIFGGYSIAGLENLEETLGNALQGLLSRSIEIGYLSGHGEKSLADAREGSARLENLVSDRYELREIVSATEIPENITTIMVNGPRSEFSESELYALDQFLMRGGNLFLLLDTVEEILPDQNMAMYGAQATYESVHTGLDLLLSSWGVSLSSGYVLDKECYLARQQGVGEIPLYYVPLLPKEGMNSKHPVSRNLAYVLFLQSAAITQVHESMPEGIKLTALASSSPQSWLLEDVTTLNPYAFSIPGPEELSKRNLAVALEGTFTSAFSASPVIFSEQEESGALKTTTHLSSSVLPGRVILVGSSAITTPAVLDENGTQPIGIFLRNAFDYLNGNEDLISMRTKGLALNTLDKTTEVKRKAIRGVNLYGLPLLTALAGLLVWRSRVRRRRKIKNHYFPSVEIKEEVSQ